ncbi:MAG: YicC family protein [Candidatus Kapaibacteriales bacterium]
MIKSMTGFSKAEKSKDGLHLSLELKSVNGKGLDLTLRSPREISPYENEIKNILRKYLTRGSVTIYVNIDQDATENGLKFDTEAAKNTLEALGEVRKELKIKETVKFDHLLSFSNSFIKKDYDKDAELMWSLTKDALETALQDFDKMRSSEGKHLYQDISKRITNIHDSAKKAEERGLERVPEEREKMKDRIARLFENDEVDEHRLQMEIVLLADKLDITEECVRLYSHIKQFREFCDSREPQGRKLNFLLQEFHREVNTIGSKANDPEISYLVVSMKEEIEKIREQVQNVE